MAIAAASCIALLFVCGTAAAQQVPALRLKPPIAVLDSDEFSQITSIRELRDGTVLVADRRENRIALVDFKANTSKQLGRIGEGPGEYRGVGWAFALSADSTIITDRISRRWLILSGNKVATTVSANPVNLAVGPRPGGFDRNGRVLGVKASHYPTSIQLGRDFADSLVLMLGSRGSARMDTIARLAGRGRWGVIMAPIISANPLASEDVGILFEDGWIAVVYVEPYRVDWRRPDDTWLRGSPLSFRGENVTRAEKCAALADWVADANSQSCKDQTFPTWPKVMPPFFPSSRVSESAYGSPGVLGLPDGRVLVRRAPSLRRPGTRYDIINRQGRLSATMQLAGNEAIIGFGRGSVYTVLTNEFGLQTLRRHPWP